MNGPTTMRTVIPAQPGFDLVELNQELGKLDYLPIVAWIIAIPAGYGTGKDFAQAHPVCAGWSCNDSSLNKIIRHPDGSICFFDDVVFEKGQEAEALASAIELQRQITAIRPGAEAAQ
jgi:hypothetical protein